MNESEKAKNRVKKLLNLANNDSAFDGEIDNALRFARRLMLEHNIIESDLEMPESPEEIAANIEYAESNAFSYGKDLSMWESWLMSAIEKLIGTIGIYRTYDKLTVKNAIGLIQYDEKGKPKIATRVVFYGPIEDTKEAVELFTEWSEIIAAMARLKFGGCFRGNGRSYAEGFALSLCKKIEDIKKQDIKLIAKTSNSKELIVAQANALMLAKKNYAENWLKNEKGINVTKYSRQSNINDSNSFGQGMADGNKADFSRKSKTLRLGR